MSAEPPVAALRAIGHPTRLEILRLVTDDELPAGDVATRLGVAQPATSQHLKVLRDAELVVVRIDGNRRLYRVNFAQIARVRDYLSELWAPSLDALRETAEARTERG